VVTRCICSALLSVETFTGSESSPIVFAPGKAATTGCQRATECSATTGCQRATECCVLIATREETIQGRLKSPLMSQREHIGKEWSGNFIGQLRKGFESIVPKRCPRKNSAL